jgi:hypothetical protein
MSATLNIRKLKDDGYLHGEQFSCEQIIDAAARKYVDENPDATVSQLYNALSDECDMAMLIALNAFDLTEYV